MSRWKQLKTIRVHKKLHETTNLCVEVMKSKGETSSPGTISRLPLDVNVILNLSNIQDGGLEFSVPKLGQHKGA